MILVNKFKNILVSGANGDIGIGLARILIQEGIENTYGCDIKNDSWGGCVFKEIIQVPKANSEYYIDAVKKIILKFNIDLFIPSSEAEIKVINDLAVPAEHILNCPVLLADSNTINLALDKFETAKFLKENLLDYPWTMDAEVNLPESVPCIYKPRSGQGSKGIEVVCDIDRAIELKGKSGYIFQELLAPDNQEYTCGIYRGKMAGTRVILFKRTLVGGLTGSGIVVENSKIENYVKDIAQLLGLKGAVNMQLRLTSRGPVLFEINPRFSSTVVFRHKLGFKDLIWAIEELAGQMASEYNPPIVGTKFYRGYAEYFNM